MKQTENSRISSTGSTPWAARLVFVCVVVLTLWGGFLRFRELGKQSFWIDEAFSVIQARAILEHGVPRLTTGATTWSYFPAHYLMAAGLPLFNDIHLGARFFPALLGTLLIPAFFFLSFQFSRTRIQALVASALLTFSTYEITWSRQARSYIFLHLAGALCVGLFLSFLHNRRGWKLCLCFLVAGLCPLFHPGGWIFPLVLVLTGLPELRDLQKWKAWLGAARAVPLVAGAILLGFLTLFLFQESNSSFISLVERIGRTSGKFYATPYLQFLGSTWGAVLLFAALGVVTGILRKRRATMAITIAAALYFVLLSFRVSLFHYRYLLPLVLFTPLLAAAGFHDLCAWLLRRKRCWEGIAMGLVIVLFVASLSTMDLNVAPYAKYYLGLTAPQPEWHAAYAWIAKDAAGAVGPARNPTTVSAFPVFHDLYLAEGGDKHYLPVTLTGHDEDAPQDALYTRAHTITSLEELLQVRGYVILDEMGFKMLTNDRIGEYLGRRQPAAVFHGFPEIRVWKQP